MNTMIKHLIASLLLLQSMSCLGDELGADTTLPAPGGNYENGSGNEENEEPGDDSQQTPEGPETPGEGTPETEQAVYVASAAEVKALGTVPGGTTIVWKNGTYAAQTVELKAAGTAGEPVVLRAETPGGVIFTGTSRLQVSGSGATIEGFCWRNPEPVAGKAVITLAKGSDACTVYNCSITGDETTEDAATDTKWVSLYGTNHRVEGCTFRDKKNIGTLLVVWFEQGVVPGHTIARNRFSRPVTLRDANGKALNGQETIRIGTSDFSMQESGCVVEENFFYHCHGEQAEIVSNKSCRNTYRRNVFVESQGSLTLRHGNDCLVTGNYFFGNGMEGTGGIRIIGERHTVEYNYLEGLAGTGYRTGICIVRGQQNPKLSGYWQVKEARIANNVVVDCKYGIMANYGSASSNQTQPVVSTVVENNLISTSSKSYYTVHVVTDPKPDITWSNNSLYGGKQSGITLETAAADPVPPQLRKAMGIAADGIVAAAGCSWEG